MEKVLVFVLLIISVSVFGQKRKAVKHFKRGKSAMTEYRYVQAVVEFTKAISFDKNYIDAYEQRGLSFLHLQRLEASAKDYEQVADLDPGRLLSLVQLIHIYHDLELPNMVLEVLDKMEVYHPKEVVSIQYQRGVSYEAIGNRKKAIQFYSYAYDLCHEKGSEFDELKRECTKRLEQLKSETSLK